MGQIQPPRTRPCSSCPYRRDAPSGLWAEAHYAVLCRYDAPTPDQPTQTLMCHQDDGRACAGWCGVHGKQAWGYGLLALRVAMVAGRLTPQTARAIVDYASPVPLWTSGAEAARHGLRDIRRPSAATIAAARRLKRHRRPRGSTQSRPASP